MRLFGLRGCLCGLLAVGVFSAGAYADDPQTSAGSPDDKVTRLEALLEAQQQQIAELERQVATASSQDMDAARVEELKRQIREILSEQEFREMLMPSVLTAGYDDGFYIRSSDDNFMMKFNGVVQFRWTHYGTRSGNRYLAPGLLRDDRTGFDTQRVRFKISGNAVSQDLTYMIEFRADAPDRYDAVINQAWINHRFVDEFQVKAGLFKLASTRQQGMSDFNQQFVDRTLTDTVFGLGYSIGVRFWGQAFDKKLEYFLDIANSLSDGENAALNRTITPDPAELDGNPAVAFRTVWHILGEDPAKDFAAEGDLDIRESPAWDLGFHYAFNEDRSDARTTRIPVPRLRLFDRGGGYGLVSTNGLQIHQVGIDTAFKWMGFSATGEYILRIVDVRRTSIFNDNVVAPWFFASGDNSTTAQHGAYVQLGYFLPIPGMEKKLEAVARVGGISALAEDQEGTWEYAAGLNYYIDGNRVKLQTDFTKIYEVPISSSYASLANVNDDALIWRVQLQLAF